MLEMSTPMYSIINDKNNNVCNLFLYLKIYTMKLSYIWIKLQIQNGDFKNFAYIT